jgi:Trp operon repressor
MIRTYDTKLKGIAKLILLAKDEKKVSGLLYDLFTESEIDKAHERVRIFAGLINGHSQREVQKETNAAIATVTHGARFLKKSSRVIKNLIASARKKNWWNNLFWRE